MFSQSGSQPVQTDVKCHLRKGFDRPTYKSSSLRMRQIFLGYIYFGQVEQLLGIRWRRQSTNLGCLLCSPQGNWGLPPSPLPCRSLQGRMRSAMKVCYLMALGFLNSEVPELTKLLMMIVGEGKDRQIIISSCTLFNPKIMFYIL